MTIGREERLKLILDLVQSQPFRTQGELVEALSAHDIEVTQSSISRDIRDLGLRKKHGAYVAPREILAGPGGLEVWVFAQSVASAGDHMVVIRCQSAMAQAIAAAVDDAQWPGVVGTIAGDDTVFVALEHREASLDLLRRLRTIAELS